MNNNVKVKLLINLGEALVGNIFPLLRAITIGLNKEVVTITFYYDKDYGDKEIDAVYSIEGELLDLGYCYRNDINMNTLEGKIYLENYYYYLGEFKIRQVNFPINLKNEKLDYWIYMRKEKNQLTLYKDNINFIDKNITLKSKIYLVIQNSLLGLIIPQIRFIFFEYNTTIKLIYIRIIYDGRFDFQVKEIASELKKRINEEIQNFNIDITNIRYDFPKFIFELKFENSISMDRRVIYSRAKECMGCWD